MENENTNSGSVNRDNGVQNQNGAQNQGGNNYGRGPVRRSGFNPGQPGQNQQGQNQGGGQNRHGHGRNRHQRGYTGGQQQDQARRQDRNEKDRYDRAAHAIRDTVESIPRRPQRGAKEETIEDIRRDIITIEKEIALEISDISVLKLNV